MSARPQHGSPARPLPVGLGWLAIMLTALCLVPAGAHLFALPNKLGLAEGEYFTAQSVYRGWSLFGVVWLLTLLAQLAMLVVLRRHRAALSVGLLGLGLLVAAFAVFFVWTLPANQATANWTQVPAAWRTPCSSPR